MNNRPIMTARKNAFNIALLSSLISLCILLASCGSAKGAEETGGQSDAAQQNGGGTAAVDFTADAGSDSSSASGTDAAGDGESANADKELLQIGEKMFVGQINDIYLNPDDYLGKSICYEGYFMYYDNGETSNRYNCVIRNGPGCCGNDSEVGFEIAWDGEMPEVDDWVKITGELERYEEDGWDYLRVKAASLEILPYRGKDTVVQ